MVKTSLLTVKAYYTVTTIKAECKGQRDRHRSMEWNSEIDPHKYAPLVLDKVAKAVQCRKNRAAFSTNGIKAIGHP